MSKTRESAVLLLRTMFVFLEEHITMDLHEVISVILKTIGDDEIGPGICECTSLLGRFVDPEAYAPLVIPRIRGDDDAEFTQVDVKWKINALKTLDCLMQGSNPTRLLPQVKMICETMCDDELCTSEQPELRANLLSASHTLVKAMEGKGKAVVEAYFLSTGRLTSLHSTMGKIFRILLQLQTDCALRTGVQAALLSLSHVQGNPKKLREGDDSSQQLTLAPLYAAHLDNILEEVLADYPTHNFWSNSDTAHVILSQIILEPSSPVLHSPDTVKQVGRQLPSMIGVLSKLLGSTFKHMNERQRIAQADVLKMHRALMCEPMLPFWGPLWEEVLTQVVLNANWYLLEGVHHEERTACLNLIAMMLLGFTYEEHASAAARTAALCTEDVDDDEASACARNASPPPVFCPSAIRSLVPVEVLQASRGNCTRLLISFLLPCLHLVPGGVLCPAKSPGLGKETRACALKLSGFFLSEIDPVQFLVPEEVDGEDAVLFQERRVKNHSLVALLYDAIVRRLDDSDENIRVLACSTLLYFNNWVEVIHRYDLVKGVLPLNEGGEDETQKLREKLPSYQQYLEQCCLRLVVGDPSKMFKLRMDTLLKGAAMTDLVTFRTYICTFRSLHTNLESDVQGICDHLLEHVEVLSSFDAMKSKRQNKSNLPEVSISNANEGVPVPIQIDDGTDSEDEIYANDDIDMD